VEECDLVLFLAQDHECRVHELDNFGSQKHPVDVDDSRFLVFMPALLIVCRTHVVVVCEPRGEDKLYMIHTHTPLFDTFTIKQMIQVTTQIVPAQPIAMLWVQIISMLH
jgi:hypothetical protein